ncbi:P-loop containing nucleoside triphosphate hydrolase protein [Desarmillaria tabescens]|uniref:Kinesin-like protein n=1 Tax=Armillaria tabescens TaxID=1929756 RepID=A0AA39KAI6_ARMTA|nr:P-loop containing nucleoside triphosphate hydrolase protein [Desarmillaria tabescens]KAK0457604.1 P-loop containing nucleoside triphosphate hydrolase protein [Desarmillaria tabescens]
MSVSSTPSSKLARRGPFTPSKRPLSTSSLSSISSSSSSSSDLMNRLNRSGSGSSGASNILGSTHKRYKAPVSSESRPRTYTKPLSTIPGSPRPKTPYERSKTPTVEDSPTSKMDVSNVDPEAVLVDSETVEADVSAEMDEAWLRTMSANHGNKDKVMVSIRVRPSNTDSAWVASSSASSIHLDPVHAKSGAPNPADNKFDFDSVLNGSPNKPIYSTVAQSHVYAAMEGYNAIIFAYGQTASGKTYTLSGDESEPGIIPRAMKDVFRFIKRNDGREYLLRCSYLEIYNESIHDLLAPVGSPVVMIQGGGGNEVILTPLREEVVTSLKGVKDVLKRGESHRRTACTDWNERSSRSHSVFRLVVESRERGEAVDESFHGRVTPAPSGRQTPGMSGRQTPGPGNSSKPGPKLQARGGRSVQTSVLSLIDLAGSEKATSDKERTREGKYINTSLLTLGTVIGTLSENAAKGKSDHVPFRNSKLTRMLQPSLSGNARISVICTINPDISAIAESTSTLLFARRIKGVKLNAQKKEIVDTDALIERYRKEIEDLKARLAEKEAAVDDRRQSSASIKRRLSVKEKTDESKAMKDLNNRIQQLTKLILTSQTVDESSADSRPGSPVKIDFDMSPYQLQQELLAARVQLESQATQILSLEAALEARPLMPPENEKDKVIADQAKAIKELEMVVKGYESNLGEPLRAVREDVEREWQVKVDDETRKREEKERWADELVKQLEKEKQTRIKLEDQARALTAFVTKLDALGLGGLSLGSFDKENESGGSPGKREKYVSLLDQVPEEEWSMTGDFSFEMEKIPVKREPFGGKENVAL